MKTFLPLITFLGLALFAKADDFAATEKFTQTYPLTPEGVVRLANINGTIEITVWDHNEVLLEAEKRAKTKEDLALIHIEVDAKPDRLSVLTSHEKKTTFFGGNVQGEVQYHLKVPVGVTLEKISSVNSRLIVEGVRGRVTLQTVNGPIRASGLASDARLETVNGAITARFASVTSIQRIEVESVNGSCEVLLPKDIGARLELASVNGGTHCEFPITVDRSTNHTLRGTIGDGTVAVKASTVNGSIRVNRG